MEGIISGHSAARVLWPRVVVVMTLMSSVGRLIQRMIAGVPQGLLHLNVSDGQSSRMQSIERKAI